MAQEALPAGKQNPRRRARPAGQSPDHWSHPFPGSCACVGTCAARSFPCGGQLVPHLSNSNSQTSRTDVAHLKTTTKAIADAELSSQRSTGHNRTCVKTLKATTAIRLLVNLCRAIVADVYLRSSGRPDAGKRSAGKRLQDKKNEKTSANITRSLLAAQNAARRFIVTDREPRSG